MENLLFTCELLEVGLQEVDCQRPKASLIGFRQYTTFSTISGVNYYFTVDIGDRLSECAEFTVSPAVSPGLAPFPAKTLGDREIGP